MKIEDSQIISIFKAYEHAKERGDKSIGGYVSPKESILENIFENEPVNVETFRKNYLPLLNLPEPIKKTLPFWGPTCQKFDNLSLLHNTRKFFKLVKRSIYKIQEK